MGQPNKRRQQKHKEREKRIRKNRGRLTDQRRAKAYDHELRKVAPYPHFTIQAEDPGSDIVQLVKEAITQFERTYTLMDQDALAVLAEQRRGGWSAFVDRMMVGLTEPLTRDQVSFGYARMTETELGLGLLRAAPENLKRRVLPMSCFTLHPNETDWDVTCRTLLARKTAHGILYQSPHKPEVNGKQVLFTRHAMLQLSDRILRHWRKNYIALTYVFGFFYECVYFEQITLQNGQEALVIYNACLRAGNLLREFWREMLGVETFDDLKDHYYIVGYCPLLLDGDMAIAKTFLTPGYRQTPERTTLRVSGRLATIRDIEMASDDGVNVISAATCDRTKKAIRWFHANGVAQVKRFDHEVFRDAYGPYAPDGTSTLPSPASPPSTSPPS